MSDNKKSKNKRNDDGGFGTVEPFYKADFEASKYRELSNKEKGKK